LTTAGLSFAQPCGGCSPCEKEEDEQRLSYGPCDCQPRGTLLQWSYGTSFSGGPDLDEPLVTDRPDFTESSSTVGLRVAQIEFGYTYTHDNDGAARTTSHSYPEALLRYGMLAEWFELRIAQNFVSETTAGVKQSGAEDLYLGAKIALTPQECYLPESAVILQTTVDSGAAPFTAGEVLPGANFVYSWDVTDSISTAGSTQLNRAIDEATGRAYTELAQSWTVGLSLSERVGAYAEWYAFFPHSADTAVSEHYFNGGLAFLINDDVQWDVRAGVGLNDAADDYFVGTGLSIRVR
jgi:hypothetical protein